MEPDPFSFALRWQFLMHFLHNLSNNLDQPSSAAHMKSWHGLTSTLNSGVPMQMLCTELAFNVCFHTQK